MTVVFFGKKEWPSCRCFGVLVEGFFQIVKACGSQSCPGFLLFFGHDWSFSNVPKKDGSIFSSQPPLWCLLMSTVGLKWFASWILEQQLPVVATKIGNGSIVPWCSMHAVDFPSTASGTVN